MRRYEVKMTDGSTKFIPAENKRQAIDRCYLWGYKVEKIRLIFNCGGKGKWVNVLAQCFTALKRPGQKLQFCNSFFIDKIFKLCYNIDTVKGKEKIKC